MRDQYAATVANLRRQALAQAKPLESRLYYGDYRDVSGIKVPFHLKMTWLDGQEDVTLTDVQLNVPVDATKFAKPNPTAPKAASR